VTTALQLIQGALGYAGEYDPGETLSSADSQGGLADLNSMLDAMATERLLVYQIVQATNSWASGTASKTIGSSGTINVARPNYIQSAFIRDSSSYDRELVILRERELYDSIILKTQQSTLPEYLFYDPAYPLGTIYLYPVPSETVTLLYNTWQILQSFAATSTDLALPPGYKEMIETNLCIRLAPKYGKRVPPEVMLLARDSLARIRRLNAPEGIMRLDPGIVHGRRFNIYTGQ
jgi:hypothetical protein